MRIFFQKNRGFWLWAALGCLVVFGYFNDLGLVPLLGRDEPRYAQVGREMWARGDWVTPTLGGHFWFEKPVLLYWGMMLSYSLFGVNEWAARFGSAVAGLMCVALIGWVAARVEKKAEKTEKQGGEASWRGYGLAAAGVMASCAGLLAFARGATFDIVLAAALCGALACFLAAEIEEKPAARRLLLIGFWIGVGTALLAKGLVGMLLPALVVSLYALLRRDGKAFWRCGLPWGIPLALLVAASWYGPMFARNGPLFWHEFFVRHQFQRYTSNEFRHQQAFYFYIPILLLFVLPWTPFLVTALASARGWAWRGAAPGDKARVFALCWLAVPVGFFSLSGSKLPSYILPALPGAALLIAERVACTARGEDQDLTLAWTAALSLILGAALLYLGPRKLDLSLGWSVWVAAPFISAGILGFLAGATKRPVLKAWSLAAIGSTLLLLLALAPDFALEKLADRNSVRALLREADRHGYNAAPVFHRQDIERTAEFYAAGRVVYAPDGDPARLESSSQMAQALNRYGKILIFLPAGQARSLEHNARLRVDFTAQNGKTALVGVRATSKRAPDTALRLQS